MSDAVKSWLHYAVAAVLVGVYVNTFDLWVWLLRVLGADRATYVPIVLTLAAGLALAVLGRRQARSGTVAWWALLLGVVLVVWGLFLPEPRFPAKRIHVAEYALLALVLRRGLSPHLGGGALLFASIVAAALFGLHDEMIQGLHPRRTFGIADLVVNSIGAVAGGLIGHGFGFFAGRRPETGGLRHATGLVAVLLASIAVYPVIAGLAGWTFN